MKAAVNALRFLALEMIERAHSGHPGVVLGFAPALYVLFTRHLVVSRQAPTWINRDRLVLGMGHASALLYAILHLTQSGLTMDDLKAFRQVNSRTPGHPERHHVLGIESTTGSLGQGIAQGVGLAIAESVLAAKFNRTGCQVIDHFTYVLCSDGGLQEGISYEATNLAGTLNLKKLIVLYDCNHVQLDGATIHTCIENVAQRFRAINWYYQVVFDGNDIAAIDQAITNAKHSGRPSMITIRTTIGQGATHQNSAQVHGQPLGTDLAVVKKYYCYQQAPFTVDPAVRQHFQQTVVARGNQQYQRWLKTSWSAFKHHSAQWRALTDAINRRWDIVQLAPNLPEPALLEATRVSSGKILDHICRYIPTWIGGAADLASSCKTPMTPQINRQTRNGTAIWYGVREHAMVAISSGIAVHGGLLPFCATFLVFSDYARAAIRTTAMMGAPVLLIFTHDSVLVGEDGPTHQPVEQLAGLRAIPNLYVVRPADFKEVWGCYQLMLNHPPAPYAMILTRQTTPQVVNTNAQAVSKGGYVVHSCHVPVHDIVIFASGSELSLAIKIAEQLKTDHQLAVKVVSLVCFKLFQQQPAVYRRQVYDHYQPFTVSIELGSTFGWKQWAAFNVGWNQFGFSGSAQQITARLRWTPAHLARTIYHHFQAQRSS